MEKTSEFWFDQLKLIAHPEGGYYLETYQSSDRIDRAGLPQRYDADRACAKAIYFLLPGEQVSRFHRLKCEEIWCYHCGSALTLFVIGHDGALQEYQLGPDWERGERFQMTIPHGVWFGARVNLATSYTLVTCITMPGFDFADFELADYATLAREYPQHKSLIKMLT